MMHAPRAALRRAGFSSIRQLLDTLESRLHLNAAYHALAGGALTQNWDNAALITAASGWTNVPSIEGFSGTALSGSDPRTILGADAGGALQMNADQTNPNGFQTGGPAEFALTTAIPATTPNTGLNTVALQGSGASDVPYIKFYLNASGVTNVRVRYDLIDIDGGAPSGTPTQPFALQYRVGNSGNFTNLDGGYVANAADQTSLATGLRNAIDVTLPAAADNQAIVEVRVMTIDAASTDQFVAVENINVSATPIPPAFGEFSFSSQTYSVSEGVGNATFTVRRLNGTSGAVSVTYATSDGSAIAPGDYANTTNVLNFADGVDSLTFTVPIVDDSDPESAENFTLTLSSPTGGAIIATPSAATVTINDNDQAGAIAFNPASYQVAENGGTVTLTVNRDGGSAGAVSVNWTAITGTATSPDDYTTTSGVVNFANGETSKTIVIDIANDLVQESSEQFTVTLSSPTGGATLGQAVTATITINDDDIAGQLAFDPATYQVLENAGTVTLTVVRTLGSSGPVSVNWTAVAGTATSPDDYTTISGVVNFANGETSKTIVINLANDAVAETSEQFTVTLGSPTNSATLGSASTATVEIVDDDTSVPTGLLINEIDINPPSADLPYQYVELRGTPNFVLSNVWLLELEGDTAQNPGKINSIIPLGGATFGSNGLLLIRSANGFAPESPATGVFDTALFDVGGTDFQPGSSSFVLLYDIGSLPLTVGADLDPTNGGSLTLPLTSTALDVVGVLDGTNNDKAYGAVLGPIGNNLSPDAPDAVSRFVNNTTPNSAAAWFWGNLVGGTSDSKTYTTVASQRSPNFPAGGILTPGGAMPSIISVASATFDFAGSSQSVVIIFSEDVGASIAASDFEVINQTAGNTPVTLTVISISPDGTTVWLGFTGTTGLTSSILTDGDYQLRVKAGEVGNGVSTLPSDHLSTFFFKNGDITHDRSVNFDDLLIVAQRYGTLTGGTFAIGDVNYDGKVNFDDLLIIAQRYGTTLVTAPPVAKTAAKKRATFSDAVIA